MRITRLNFRRGLWRLCLILQICWAAAFLIGIFVVFPWNKGSDERANAFNQIRAETEQCRHSIDIPSTDFEAVTGKLEDMRKQRLAEAYQRVAICDKSEEEKLVAFRGRSFHREAYSRYFTEWFSASAWKGTAPADLFVVALFMVWPSVLYCAGLSLAWTVKMTVGW